MFTGEMTDRNKQEDTLPYVYSVVAYIERHLSEELAPERVAARHFVSLSRLYRDFYAYTGHSVKEYIRKRRISNACEKIKCSDTPLAVVAEESGCQTQQAFQKQFKSLVGMTPMAYRQGETYFYFYPFSAGEQGLAVKVGAESIPACAITRFYDPCLTGLEDRAIAALGPAGGRVFGRNGKQIGNRFCYEVMTEIPGEGKTTLYATCATAYREKDIGDGWNYLYNTWLSASMFEETGDGYFEEYLFRNGRPHKLKLYLPVKKRKTARHIEIALMPATSFLAARGRGHNAEREASKKVISFLQERYPILLCSARRFLVCENGDETICGVECGGAFGRLPEGSGLEIIHIPAGSYAVLPEDCLGDIRVGGAKMEAWLRNNRIAHENEPVFAVYETQNGQYDGENVRMKVCKRLKVDTNG